MWHDRPPTVAVHHVSLPWRDDRPFTQPIRAGYNPAAMRPSAASRLSDHIAGLGHGLLQFLRLAATGLGQIGFPAPTATDDRGQRFDNIPA